MCDIACQVGCGYLTGSAAAWAFTAIPTPIGGAFGATYGLVSSTVEGAVLKCCRIDPESKDPNDSAMKTMAKVLGILAGMAAGMATVSLVLGVTITVEVALTLAVAIAVANIALFCLCLGGAGCCALAAGAAEGPHGEEGTRRFA